MSPATRLLFSPLRLGPLTLPNRIVCVPLYLAYPDPDSEVNDLVLDYKSPSPSHARWRARASRTSPS